MTYAALAAKTSNRLAFVKKVSPRAKMISNAATAPRRAGVFLIKYKMIMQMIGKREATTVLMLSVIRSKVESL
jgi:hypothetical protein